MIKIKFKLMDKMFIYIKVYERNGIQVVWNLKRMIYLTAPGR